MPFFGPLNQSFTAGRVIFIVFHIHVRPDKFPAKQL